MQQLEMNTGQRLLDVVDDIPEPAAGVMKMSADSDDQADQQHELADPDMAETDHSVLEKPWLQLYSQPIVEMQPVEDCKGVSDVVIASKPEHQMSFSVEHRLELMKIGW